MQTVQTRVNICVQSKLMGKDEDLILFRKSAVCAGTARLRAPSVAVYY
ncbi:hypothetical protein HDC92_003346 [Pedobacter sp. AK017]|nr:hypothetical protein [Pedobacter sp. AK017]